jgi:hypothetical protein
MRTDTDAPPTVTDVDLPVAKPQPAAAAAPPQRLEYDKPSMVSRRQMNLFLLLLTVNTILFAAFVCLPAASPWLKQQWEDWQRRRAATKAAEAQRQEVASCLTFAQPPTTVVYAEDTDDARKLLASAGRSRTLAVPGSNTGVSGWAGAPGSSNSLADLLTVHGWQGPALRGRAEPWHTVVRRSSRFATPSSADDSVVFLHGMRTPGGRERLVWVSLSANQELRSPQQKGEPHVVETRRKFRGWVFDPADLNKVTETTITLTEPPGRHTSFHLVYGGDGTRPRIERVERKGVWRIFAGQIDPADPSRLTILYEVDGQTGVIDGRLTDGDRLMLEPRVGALVVWRTGAEYVWDLGAAAATTRPAAAPFAP